MAQSNAARAQARQVSGDTGPLPMRHLGFNARAENQHATSAQTAAPIKAPVGVKGFLPCSTNANMARANGPSELMGPNGSSLETKWKAGNFRLRNVPAVFQKTPHPDPLPSDGERENVPRALLPRVALVLH